jgi:hypothetical protein
MRQVIDEGRNTIEACVPRRCFAGPSRGVSRVRDELALQDDVEFRVIVEGRPKALHPILRDEIYRIGREALINSARHSGAKRIEVELEYTDKELRVRIRTTARYRPASVALRPRRILGTRRYARKSEKIGGPYPRLQQFVRWNRSRTVRPGYVAFEHHAGSTAR